MDWRRGKKKELNMGARLDIVCGDDAKCKDQLRRNNLVVEGVKNQDAGFYDQAVRPRTSRTAATRVRPHVLRNLPNMGLVRSVRAEQWLRDHLGITRLTSNQSMRQYSTRSPASIWKARILGKRKLDDLLLDKREQRLTYDKLVQCLQGEDVFDLTTTIRITDTRGFYWPVVSTNFDLICGRFRHIFPNVTSAGVTPNDAESFPPKIFGLVEKK